MLSESNFRLVETLFQAIALRAREFVNVVQAQLVMWVMVVESGGISIGSFCQHMRPGQRDTKPNILGAKPLLSEPASSFRDISLEVD